MPTRGLAFLLAALPLAGCSRDVALKDPSTGQVATCDAGLLGDINPWSQQDMCVEEHVSEGWVTE